ncbi:hypothetical protein K449DRAFT_341471, partial [Hypoxylon sp. EC38]
KKQDSPSANPAIQLGCIALISTSGLSFGTTLGKAIFKFSGNPEFNEAFILTISKRPFVVKCSLRTIKFIICLNNKKSALFCVSKGYFSK